MSEDDARTTIFLSSYADEAEAERAAAYLRDHGIETVLARDDPGRMGITRSAMLSVLSADLDRARRLLNVRGR